MESLKSKDEKLYEEAEARVNFRRHAKTYVVINILIWGFWYATRARFGHYDGYWPAYSTMGWGFGLLSHYMGVYTSSNSAVEKEFKKLKRERGEA